MRRIFAAFALVLACAAPALAAKPPKPGQPAPTVTIAASAAEVTFGKTVTLSGATTNVAAGTAVQLEQNPYPYAGFKPSGKSTVVDPTGHYAFAGIQPQVHTQYRVVVKSKPQATSSAAFVRVRLAVSLHVSDATPRRGSSVRFSGTAAPAEDGKPVLIQKRTTSGWKTAARTTLLDNGTADSKYSKKLKIRATGRYRVVVESLDQGIDNGTSATKRLRVH